MTHTGARRIALSLPEVVEQDHHGRPSFRVGGKIFATVPDSAHLNIMIDEDIVSVAVSSSPRSCEELWWGKRLAGVRVALAGVEQALVSDLLHEAWRRKAPKRLKT